MCKTDALAIELRDDNLLMVGVGGSAPPYAEYKSAVLLLNYTPEYLVGRVGFEPTIS